MSDYIDRILTRSFGPTKTIRPRLASHFEPSFWNSSPISQHHLGSEESEFETPREAGFDRSSNALSEETNDIEVGISKSRSQQEYQLSMRPVENHPQTSEIRQATPARIHAHPKEASESQRRLGLKQRVDEPIEMNSIINGSESSVDSLLNSIEEENVSSSGLIAEKYKPIAELTSEHFVNDREISRSDLLGTSVEYRKTLNSSVRIENDNRPDSRKGNKEMNTKHASSRKNPKVISEAYSYQRSVRGEVGSGGIGRGERENGRFSKIKCKKGITIKKSLDDSILASTGNKDISSLSRVEDNDKMAFQHILIERNRKTKSQSIDSSLSSSAEIKPLNPSLQNNLVARPFVRTFAKQETSKPKEPAVMPPEPTIQVTIGRIEVKGIPQPSKSKEQLWTPPVMSLENYLRQRNNGASS